MNFATLSMLAVALLGVLSVPSTALGSSLNATVIHVGPVHPVEATPAMSKADTNPKGGSATTSGAMPTDFGNASESDDYESELQLLRAKMNCFKERKADLPPTHDAHSLVDEILLLLQQLEETIEEGLAINEKKLAVKEKTLGCIEESLAIDEEIRARCDSLPEESPLSKQEDSLEAPGATDVSKNKATTESTTETIEPDTADPQEWVEHLLNRIERLKRRGGN